MRYVCGLRAASSSASCLVHSMRGSARGVDCGPPKRTGDMAAAWAEQLSGQASRAPGVRRFVLERLQLAPVGAPSLAATMHERM